MIASDQHCDGDEQASDDRRWQVVAGEERENAAQPMADEEDHAAESERLNEIEVQQAVVRRSAKAIREPQTSVTAPLRS